MEKWIIVRFLLLEIPGKKTFLKNVINVKKTILFLLFINIYVFSFGQNIKFSDIEAQSNINVESSFSQQSTLYESYQEVKQKLINNNQEYIESYYIIQAKQKELQALLAKKEDSRYLLIKEIEQQEKLDIDEIIFSTWQPNELDEEGNPTQSANSYRNKQIDSIKEKYQQKKNLINSNDLPDTLEIYNIRKDILDEMRKLENDNLLISSVLNEVFRYNFKMSTFDKKHCGWKSSLSFETNEVFTFENNELLVDYFL